MSFSSKYRSSRLLDPKNAQFNGQSRVNAEIFTAMELLGSKLEKSEAERRRLENRLATIESAATLDETTGKIYLPAVISPEISKKYMDKSSSRWMVLASFMSSTIAVISLAIVLLGNSSINPVFVKEEIAFNKTSGWKDLAFSVPEKDIEISKTVPVKILDEEPSDEELEHVALKIEEPVKAKPVLNVKPGPSVKIVETKFVETKKPAVVVPKVEVEAKIEVKTKTVEVKKEVAPPVKTVVTFKSDNLAKDKNLPEKLYSIETQAYNDIAEAQHDLGIIYASGKLVDQDYKRAVYWLKKAADNGVANANYNLAVMYQKGIGAEKNMGEALKWYKQAAELGHPEAMYNLGLAYLEGMGEDKNITKSVSYFKRAARAGVLQAAYNLGVLYESDFTGNVDINKSLEWYGLAADKGHREAMASIERIKESQTLTMADMVEPAAGN